MFLSRYQSPGGATSNKNTNVSPVVLFSSRYQSPGGATAAPVPNQDVAFGFHPVIKVRAVQLCFTEGTTAYATFSSRYQSPGGATQVEQRPRHNERGFSSRYQSPGGATDGIKPNGISFSFSSRYQSPGGATFREETEGASSSCFHPVIKVRAVQLFVITAGQ